VTYTYQANEFDEILSVRDAIRFERQLLGDLDDIDIRYNAGYIDGVVATMAAEDPFLEDAGDVALMKEIVRDGRLNINGYSDRKHAYLSYIREVAAIQEATDAKV
jgi:hypothetical protein